MLWCKNAQPDRFCVSQNSVHRAWIDPQRGGGGTTQSPNSPCMGTARHTQLTSPHSFQGRPDARVRTPQTILGLSLCPTGQEGLGQSDGQGASGHQVLCKATLDVCAPSVKGAGAGHVLGPLLHPSSPCLYAWGSQDRVPHRPPFGEPACTSAYISASASLCISHG